MTDQQVGIVAPAARRCLRVMKMTQEAEGNVEVSEGKLVWYNERKGYGFVRIGEEEVFLHRSTLDRFGLVRLLTGDVVTVSLSTNEHGRVIKDLLSVERPLTPSPPAATEPEDGEVRAVVNFSTTFADTDSSLPTTWTRMSSSIRGC